MKEDIRRITNLVKEGKISAEDAMELIEAIAAQSTAANAASTSGSATATTAGAAKTKSAKQTVATAPEPEQTPPPPPQPEQPTAESSPNGSGQHVNGESTTANDEDNPFKGLFDAFEKLGTDLKSNVNWQDLKRQARESARKGIADFRASVEQMKKSGWSWFTASETKEIELPINAVAGKTIRIEHPCGDIRVLGGFEQGTVKAIACVRGRDSQEARAKADDYTLVVEESDHLISIRQPDLSGLSVDLELHVAAGVMLEVRSEAGDLTVENTGAGCRVQAKSGDVSLRGLSGAIEVSVMSGDLVLQDANSPSVAIESKSGDVLVQRVIGNLNARSASGDVKLLSVSGRAISIESVSGDVDLDLVEPIHGAVNVRTVNGNATISITDGSDCRVMLSTLRGVVSCELELDEASTLEQRVTGRLGEGTGSLDVSAVNGDIHLGLRDQTSTETA